MNWSFGDFLWSMVVFFFWFTIIWMFIAVFADIFRRDDLSGWAKAGWVLLVVVLPFIGILIYVIVRPKVTASDKRMFAGMREEQRQMAGYSPADEIDKLARLQSEGKITAEEFQTMKKQVMV
jgi:Phospholipase_D-nuclease N-terminal